MSGYMTGLAVGNGRRARKNAELADANYRASKSWEEYAQRLERQVREWQELALESEAISRASIAAYKAQNNGDGPRTVLGAESFDNIKEQRKGEIREDWGLK